MLLFTYIIQRNTQDRLNTALEQAETINDPALLEAQSQVDLELQQQQEAADGIVEDKDDGATNTEDIQMDLDQPEEEAVSVLHRIISGCSQDNLWLLHRNSKYCF